MKKHLLLLGLLIPLLGIAQNRTDRLTPKWMYGHIPAANAFVEFKTVRVPNTGQGNMNTAALAALVRKWGEESQVSHSAELKDIGTLERDKGKMVGGSHRQVDVLTVLAAGSPVTLNCMLVDDWISDKEYCAVYQLANTTDALFIPCTVTTRYGAAPVFMSLFPGTGQFYKGDPIKGGLLMGGCLLGGAGIILFENQRRAFASQREQTHDVNLIKKYAASEKNMGIARNVTIGVAAALYLYNLIDAAVAPGARRIQVTPSGFGYSF